VTDSRPVTVFGGTGFLGRRIARRLLDKGFLVRIATRHPDRSRKVFGNGDTRIEYVEADVNDDRLVAAAVAGAVAAINAVSLYVERGAQTFQSVHVEAAARIASQAANAGVKRLVLVSGIGADLRSRSSYIRSRGMGEEAVRAAFPAATIVRSAVMFGPDDALLVPLGNMLRRVPVFPMFGRGRTRIQPAYVEDVAEGIVRSLKTADSKPLYEFGGPVVYRYRELLATVASHLGSRVLLVPIPFVAWHAVAFAAEFLPKPPITRNQVELMQVDNVADPAAGFGTLGIEPCSVEHILPAILRKH
jgi:uncharacterized protein YbjT (DUF2867 family)